MKLVKESTSLIVLRQKISILRAAWLNLYLAKSFGVMASAIQILGMRMEWDYLKLKMTLEGVSHKSRVSNARIENVNGNDFQDGKNLYDTMLHVGPSIHLY